MARETVAPSDNLVLYHAWGSSASRKVRFCLEEKQLTYVGKVVDLFQMEQHSEAYRKLNPSGVVPTLIHAGHAVVESTVINEYIDTVFPDAPLRPSDPFETAKMRVWTKYADEVAIRAFQVTSWNRVMGPVATKWSDEEMEDRLQSIPTPGRREDWRRMAREPFNEAEIAFAVAQIRKTLEMMDQDLQAHPWLAGSAFSLADISMSPYIVRMNEQRAHGLRLEDYTRVASWWKRVQARPAFPRAKIEPAITLPEELSEGAPS